MCMCVCVKFLFFQNTEKHTVLFFMSLCAGFSFSSLIHMFVRNECCESVQERNATLLLQQICVGNRINLSSIHAYVSLKHRKGRLLYIF